MSPEYRAEGIHVDFDGVKALDDVGIDLREREILGLIGPNGAGKTTLVNVLTGFQRPDSGSVRLDGKDVTGWSPSRLARHGLARTFQGSRLFKELTVAENVEVAALGVGAGPREAIHRRTTLLELLSLTAVGEMRADSLPYGAQRRLEIARALAIKPQFLLLDEPAAGLSEPESEELVRSIRIFRDDYGCGILIIEHDMQVIMGVCERIHVLDYGKSIKEGTPEEIRTDEAVLAAYLGPQGGVDA